MLAGPDGFFRPCSRHRVRPSYGDFLNSFAMKARAGPHGSYDKCEILSEMIETMKLLTYSFPSSEDDLQPFSQISRFENS